jgi:DNA-binding transcriptional ArsR family regulator
MKTKTHDPMQEALEFLGKVIREPAKYPERFIAIPRSSPLLTKLFSPEPNRILDYLQKHHGVPSVQTLADALHRNKAAVSRDVKLLQNIGLISARRQGKEKVLEPTNKMVLVR